jgi:hypothetical protein
VFDETSKAATLQDKATFIKEQSALGPVLVYCNEDFLEELRALNLTLLVIDH